MPDDYGREHAASVRGVPVMTAEAPLHLGENAELSDYLAYAALNNPGLEAAFNRWKAELERIPQVTALPDPRCTYRYYVEEVETQRQSVEVGQTFPWFGKLKLHGDVAFEEAETARERYEAAKLKLFRQVKDAYYEYYYLARAADVVRENRDLAKHFEEVARARYRTGGAQLADVVRAQVELGKLENELESLEKKRQPAAAQLNAGLNRPLAEARPWPKMIEEETIVSTDEEVLRLLAQRNPELKAIEHEITRQQNAAALARKDGYPDVTLELNYEMGSAAMADISGTGRDPIIVGISVNVPIWVGKYRAAEREARRRQWAAIKEKADQTNMLGYRAKLALYEFRDAERKISLYRDTLLPLARESVKTTETAFAAGKASFLDLVDAQRVMLEFELSQERALTDHAQRLAELDMLVGQELPRGKPVAVPKEEMEGEKEETQAEETGEKAVPEPAPDTDESRPEAPSDNGTGGDSGPIQVQ
jgi:outer membrane protein TolC